MTVTALAICVGTLAVVYLYVFGIGPTAHSISQVKGQMIARRR